MTEYRPVPSGDGYVYEVDVTSHSRRTPEYAFPPSQMWTASFALSPEAAAHPEHVDAARSELSGQLDRYAVDCGFNVIDVIWTTDPWPTDTSRGVRIHLSAKLMPRTDGDWPAIHAAIREDTDDRALAAVAAVSVSHADAAIRDRLDGVDEPRDVWLGTDPPEPF